MDLTQSADGAGYPRYPGGIGDHATSQSLLAGIAMALFHKERTGQGQLVDACLLRTGTWCVGVPVLLAQHGYGKAARRTRVEAGNPFFNSYTAKDGVGIQLLGLQQARHMPKVLDALGLAAAVSADPRFDTPKKANKNRRELIQLLADTLATRTFAEWEPALRAKDVWYCRVRTVEEQTADPQNNAVGAFVNVPVPGIESKFKIVASPMQLSASDDHLPRRGAPALGQHTAEVLGEIGVQATPEITGAKKTN